MTATEPTLPLDLPPLWTLERRPGPVLGAAIHAGHGLRPQIAGRLVLPEDDRLREEDPFTDRMLPRQGSRLVGGRSRFEVDLNRPRDGAVYRTPDDAWGLELWNGSAPTDEVVAASLAQYDRFYRAVEHLLAEMTDECGRVVVYSVHSYNHRRDGADQPPADPVENPVVNLGTGNLDRERWAPVLDTFLDALSQQEVGGRRLDVRENVRFRGGYFSKWVAKTFPETVCHLAIEVKKVFMDEWSGEPDGAAIDAVRRALEATVPPVVAALEAL